MIREGETRAAKLFIKRTQPTTDESPPWQGISFLLPVGSDQLADQLKNAFSDCKTLRQRKHKAAILFLETELEEMKVRDEKQSHHPEAQDNHILSSPLSDSIELFDQPSTGSTQQNTISSSCTSPTTTQSAQSPKLTDRSRSHLLGSEHQQSSKAQTFVFSAVDGRTLQPKTKRKMTVDERVVYKQTRKRGACDKCKRQKGKCTHGDNSVSTKSRQVINSSNSPTNCSSPMRSAEILKTDGTYRNVNRYNDPQPTTHRSPSAPGNKSTSFVTDSISQDNEQWSSGMEREREVDALYVHTAQSFQDPVQESPPGMQNPEWACSVENFNNPYTGVHSSPSRSFRSLYSPAVGYNGFHSFSPEFPMDGL